MNKGFQIILSILLLVIIGGLIYFSMQNNNRANIELEENLIESTNTESSEFVDSATSSSDVIDEENNQEIIMENQIVVLNTNQGKIKIELFNDRAPKTAGNFAKLAVEGFYNGTRFHRVIKDFMIQGGDPLSKDVANKMMWGTGDPGYKFEDEFGEGLSNVVGTLSMANSGPNTNGSQFFINTADNVFLDGKHAVFGKVIEGMDIVTKIEEAPKDPTDKPLEDMLIESVIIQ
jgi:cyclophilin family peptidyl-prolyl cis-trans isomerase